jgi:hypothetical protein
MRELSLVRATAMSVVRETYILHQEEARRTERNVYFGQRRRAKQSLLSVTSRMTFAVAIFRRLHAEVAASTVVTVSPHTNSRERNHSSNKVSVISRETNSSISPSQTNRNRTSIATSRNPVLAFTCAAIKPKGVTWIFRSTYCFAMPLTHAPRILFLITCTSRPD